GNASLLTHAIGFLDPFARLLGLDGVILAAFILGFPANEIVLPIILMGYLATGTLQDMEGAAALGSVLTQNGWTTVTALCTMLFSLFHWPCSTTCLTIWKETKSPKWTLLAVATPTAVGMVLCFAAATLARCFS
ncbi:MAG: nucleoside recognition domain-containing protein, partial [Oscillospiraceae bacterium]